MTMFLKGVYCGAVYVSILPRVKPWVIQSFLTFDSMDPKV